MIGQRIKHYEVEAELGKGGMGVVYRARDSRLGRAVALKLLPQQFAGDADRRRRFVQEARAACAVNHPAIAQVYDIDEEDGAIFIAMELVEGKTVRQLLLGRELDLLGALGVGIQVGEGLAKAHEAGIVHRDIKAENVIVTPDGHAKILDFGLAKLMDSGAAQGDELSRMETVARTQPGFVVGTLRYMSPEQARGLAVDHRSDLFSLGVLIYEMVTGQLPFGGNTALDTMHAIAFEEIRPVTSMRANVPQSLQRAVTRCLRKQAKDRYPDAKELVADLRSVEREVESGASTPTTLATRFQDQLDALREAPGAWLGGAAAGLGMLAILALLIATDHISMPFLIMTGITGAFVWRRLRNRQRRLVRWFATRAGKIPEVQLVAYEGQRITVVSREAVARTHVRVHQLVETLNSKMFWGEPFTAVVRDDIDEAGLKALLASGSGILFVRDDEAEKKKG